MSQNAADSEGLPSETFRIGGLELFTCSAKFPAEQHHNVACVSVLMCVKSCVKHFLWHAIRFKPLMLNLQPTGPEFGP